MALTDQMIRAARLEIPFYEEVEKDTTQTNNALTVVVISSLAAGIGSAIGGTMRGSAGGAVVLGLVGGIVLALVAWGVWTGCVYLVGTKLFGGTATWGEVLRTVGFAYSPNVLQILIFIPVLGGLIGLVASIWTLVATVVAVRQSLDINTGPAIIVSIIGAILAFIVLAVIGSILAIPIFVAGALS